MSAAIETRSLSRRFDGQIAVDDLTMRVEPGEVVALLGPNGAGKTTTVRLLNGILIPDQGSATVLGLDSVADGEALRRETGVLTENAGLDDRLTARENLEFTARTRGLGKRSARTKALDLLERFDMAKRANSQVGGFSTGQRKRVALARALIHDPSVLFLDEPTSGLDPAATRGVTDLISKLSIEQGRTVLLATHFLGEAGKLADKMAMLYHGRLHAFGDPDQIAADLWPGFDVIVEVDKPVDRDLVRLVAGSLGVLSAVPLDNAVMAHVEHRDVVPALVRMLVERDIDVYRAEPRPPTLEDVYFEIEARIAASDPV